MIFPSLKNKKFGYVNLNLEAIEYMNSLKINIEDKNLLFVPNFCQEMVDSVHKKYNLDFSFGGWMEDRSFLWKNSYLEKRKTFVHLGVDLNVSFGTEVSADFNSIVVKIDSDYPEEGGWGTRVILKHETAPIYMIYAHLDKDVLVKLGDQVVKGMIFAKVGKAPYNGNWFQHLHVQTISADYYKKLEDNNSWNELDGYGTKEDIVTSSERFLDPMNYIELR